MSWASAGSSKLSRAIAVKSSSLRDIDRSPSMGRRRSSERQDNATQPYLLPPRDPVPDTLRISHNAQHGARFEVVGKCSRRFIESHTDYSVKLAPEQASASVQIRAHAWRGRGRDEHVFPAPLRLDEELRGRCSRPKPSDHSCLRTILLQGNHRTSDEAFSHPTGR
jgi:hypothetical protein